MIKVLLLDCDGPVIKREMYFSQRLSRDFGVPSEIVMEFFKNEFLLCETGKADLKEELKKYVGKWGWQKSVDELLEYWFSGERELDNQMVEYIKILRSKDIKVYIQTNNEKYRVEDIKYKVGLDKILDGFFTSYGLGYFKPDVKFWEAAYQALTPIDKPEVLVWDDKPESIKTAKQFGFNAEHYQTFELFTKTMHNYIK